MPRPVAFHARGCHAAGATAGGAWYCPPGSFCARSSGESSKSRHWVRGAKRPAEGRSEQRPRTRGPGGWSGEGCASATGQPCDPRWPARDPKLAPSRCQAGLMSASCMVALRIRPDRGKDTSWQTTGSFSTNFPLKYSWKWTRHQTAVSRSLGNKEYRPHCSGPGAMSTSQRTEGPGCRRMRGSAASQRRCPEPPAPPGGSRATELSGGPGGSRPPSPPRALTRAARTLHGSERKARREEPPPRNEEAPVGGERGRQHRRPRLRLCEVGELRGLSFPTCPTGTPRVPAAQGPVWRRECTGLWGGAERPRGHSKSAPNPAPGALRAREPESQDALGV